MPVAEGLQLDVVPDGGEGSLDDSGLNDGSGSWNGHLDGCSVELDLLYGDWLLEEGVCEGRGKYFT